MKRTPIRRRSAKKARTDAQLVQARRLVEARANGVCELNTPVCAGAAVHVHHLLLRSQGGNTHDPALMAATCVPCHEFLHAHPKLSYERGWLIRSTS